MELKLWSTQWDSWTGKRFETNTGWYVLAEDAHGNRVRHYYMWLNEKRAEKFLAKVEASGKTFKDFEASEHWEKIDPVFGSSAHNAGEPRPLRGIGLLSERN